MAGATKSETTITRVSRSTRVLTRQVVPTRHGFANVEAAYIVDHYASILKRVVEQGDIIQKVIDGRICDD